MRSLNLFFRKRPSQQQQKEFCKKLKDSGQISNSGNYDIHIIDIVEPKTTNFPWEMCITFFMSDFVISDSTATRDWLNSFEGVCLVKTSRSLLSQRIKSSHVVLFSTFRWLSQVPSEVREELFLEHFDKERDLQLFRAFEFHTTISSKFEEAISGQIFDFNFRGFCKSRSDFELVCANEQSKEMRSHASKFIDLDTRQLAFGHVSVIKG